MGLKYWPQNTCSIAKLLTMCTLIKTAIAKKTWQPYLYVTSFVVKGTQRVI